MTQITDLLRALDRGEAGAADELFNRIYKDLKQLATHRLARERPDHTLQPTALVHEVYLRLLGGPNTEHSEPKPQFEGSRHFFAAAAEAMRRILVESARSKGRKKRGGDLRRANLDPDRIGEPEMADKLLSLDEALTRLADADAQLAELVTLRFFGGLTLKEAAAQLGLPRRTADARWAYARAWLLAEMKAD